MKNCTNDSITCLNITFRSILLCQGFELEIVDPANKAATVNTKMNPKSSSQFQADICTADSDFPEELDLEAINRPNSGELGSPKMDDFIDLTISSSPENSQFWR